MPSIRRSLFMTTCMMNWLGGSKAFVYRAWAQTLFPLREDRSVTYSSNRELVHLTAFTLWLINLHCAYYERRHYRAGIKFCKNPLLSTNYMNYNMVLYRTDFMILSSQATRIWLHAVVESELGEDEDNSLVHVHRQFILLCESRTIWAQRQTSRFNRSEESNEYYSDTSRRFSGRVAWNEIGGFKPSRYHK